MSNLNSPCSVCRLIVRARPPTNGAFSTVIAGTPALLNTYAEQRPPGPAPMTTVRSPDGSERDAPLSLPEPLAPFEGNVIALRSFRGTPPTHAGLRQLTSGRLTRRRHR